MLPPAVLTLIRAHFPGAPVHEQRAAIGGYSHLTSHLTLGAVACVAKAEAVDAKRVELRREARMLGALASTDLPIPRLVALIESPDWSVEILSELPGSNGIALFNEAPGTLSAGYHALGRVLAQVHQVQLGADVAAELSILARVARARAQVGMLPLAADQIATLVQALDSAAWRDQAACVVHGDPGLHNVLWDGRHVTALLDWEWSGWGSPRIDMAWLHWTMQWRRVGRLWQRAGAGYAEIAGQVPSTEGLEALQLGLIAMILLRSRDTPDAFAEWQRRLVWTIEQHRSADWVG